MIKRALPAAIAMALTSSYALAQDTVTSSAARPEVEEISVIGRYVPDEKRNTSALSSVLSNEEFSRSGDTNIAEGLKRVAGLSLVGGKYVYVRGLGERYSSALLNGSSMPSPEPLNRVVPLDLFPNAIMDSVVVQKTYSAQFPSEFGGGVLQMRTKKSSDEFFFNIATSIAGTEGTNFSSGFKANEGGKDWLGYDDGTRAMPDLLKQATADGQRLQRRSPYLDTGGYTSDELQAIGKSLKPTYDLGTQSVPADIGATVSLGNYHDIGSTRFNYLAAVDYKNSWDKQEIERNTYKVSSGTDLVRQDSFTYYGTENNVDISSILATNLEFNENHSISATNILLRQSDNIAGQEVGFWGDEKLDSTITQIEYIERELVSNQLQGDHYFPDQHELNVTWRANRSTADRNAPDTREYRYDDIDGESVFNLRADGNVRRYSELSDTSHDYAIDANMVFYGPMNSTIVMSTGYDKQKSERDYSIRRFTFFELGDVVNREGFLSQPLSQILSTDNIGPNGFELRETTRPTDTYAASRSLESYYLQADINFSDRFQLLAGVRQEDYTQNVQTFDLFRPDNVIEGNLATSDLLPGITATYINGNHQFRLGYSETTSRPDFRELSPATFTNPLTGYEVVGNPNLKVASIKNYDLRWEWYFSRTDSLSLGYFMKDFDSPIESVVQPGANSARSYVNAKSANNQGIEFEIRKGLDFLGERMSDFYVSGNASYIESEVTIGVSQQNILTNSSRPLQGQSDWLFNGQIGYDNFNGLTATMLYHYFGERIYEVGILGAPDLIEEPHGELDLVLIREFGDHWKLNIKAQNLLDERKEITQGGFVATGYNEGRKASLKLEYRF
ncbi:MAG: TonB-dependent receptor [Pseudomonadales bacterium]|nr:TonB-dependent receptor [Pseudomonadales bacterium]MCP5358797.1 TonB-dependent receptor [Pseudomonadales bacterium]